MDSMLGLLRQAEAQFNEQKCYCIASVDALVKLLLQARMGTKRFYASPLKLSVGKKPVTLRRCRYRRSSSIKEEAPNSVIKQTKVPPGDCPTSFCSSIRKEEDKEISGFLGNNTAACLPILSPVQFTEDEERNGSNISAGQSQQEQQEAGLLGSNQSSKKVDFADPPACLEPVDEYETTRSDSHFSLTFKATRSPERDPEKEAPIALDCPDSFTKQTRVPPGDCPTSLSDCSSIRKEENNETSSFLGNNTAAGLPIQSPVQQVAFTEDKERDGNTSAEQTQQEQLEAALVRSSKKAHFADPPSCLGTQDDDENTTTRSDCFTFKATRGPEINPKDETPVTLVCPNSFIKQTGVPPGDYPTSLNDCGSIRKEGSKEISSFLGDNTAACLPILSPVQQVAFAEDNERNGSNISPGPSSIPAACSVLSSVCGSLNDCNTFQKEGNQTSPEASTPSAENLNSTACISPACISPVQQVALTGEKAHDDIYISAGEVPPSMDECTSIGKEGSPTDTETSLSEPAIISSASLHFDDDCTTIRNQTSTGNSSLPLQSLNTAASLLIASPVQQVATSDEIPLTGSFASIRKQSPLLHHDDDSVRGSSRSSLSQGSTMHVVGGERFELEKRADSFEEREHSSDMVTIDQRDEERKTRIQTPCLNAGLVGSNRSSKKVHFADPPACLEAENDGENTTTRSDSTTHSDSHFSFTFKATRSPEINLKVPKASNLVAGVRSFLPLVVQAPVVAIANGKKEVKVKALGAAEAAKKHEERRNDERKRRLEGMRRRDEERRKKEAEMNDRKRKKEDNDKKEREEKRRKVEDAIRMKKEQEERVRADLEEKEQRRKAMQELERGKKVLEEEMKKQKRLEKEKEAERRRKVEEDAKATWLASKEAERKRREETFQRMKVLEKEQRRHTDKNASMEIFRTSQEVQRAQSTGLLGQALRVPKPYAGTPAVKSCVGAVRKQFLASTDLDEEEEGPLSYEISPYKDSSDEESAQQSKPKIKKAIPLWARKECLAAQLARQAQVDPDEIFAGASGCSLNAVFGTTGNNKRRDFSQRSRSGDWVEDMATWKEELNYKKSMGYLQPGP